MSAGAQTSLRHFVVFFGPAIIIPWYYRTVHSTTSLIVPFLSLSANHSPLHNMSAYCHVAMCTWGTQMFIFQVHFYRYSVSWPRILPTGHDNVLNQADIAYYNNLINKLIANGIQPMVSFSSPFPPPSRPLHLNGRFLKTDILWRKYSCEHDKLLSDLNIYYRLQSMYLPLLSHNISNHSMHLEWKMRLTKSVYRLMEK